MGDEGADDDRTGSSADAAPDSLKAALGYAAVGLRSFPVRPQTKLPWITGWPRRASCDPTAVERLFTGKASAGVGLALGRGIFAIDIDLRDGKDGIASITGS